MKMRRPRARKLPLIALGAVGVFLLFSFQNFTTPPNAPAPLANGSGQHSADGSADGSDSAAGPIHEPTDGASFAHSPGLSALPDSMPNSVSLAMLKPKFAYAETGSAHYERQASDIRNYAPRKPASIDEPSLVSPESGGDLNSIGQDWLQRQAKNLAGGADERLIARVNKNLNRWLKFEPVTGEPWPEPNDGSGGAGSGSSTGGDGDSSTETDIELSGFAPTQLRLVNLNRFELKLANQSQVSCLIQGDSVQWDVSKSLNQRVDLNLRHDSGSQANSIRVHYSW